MAAKKRIQSGTSACHCPSGSSYGRTTVRRRMGTCSGSSLQPHRDGLLQEPAHAGETHHQQVQRNGMRVRLLGDGGMVLVVGKLLRGWQILAAESILKEEVVSRIAPRRRNTLIASRVRGSCAGRRCGRSPHRRRTPCGPARAG